MFCVKICIKYSIRCIFKFRNILKNAFVNPYGKS